MGISSIGLVAVRHKGPVSLIVVYLPERIRSTPRPLGKPLAGKELFSGTPLQPVKAGLLDGRAVIGNNHADVRLSFLSDSRTKHQNPP